MTPATRRPAAAMPEVRCRTRAEWRAWLEANHERQGSIWLLYPKKTAKGSGFVDLDYDAIVEEALCVGWVDSVPRQRHDGYGMLRISPRKPGSAWSKVNKARITRLVKEGRMRPAGLAKVEAAKRDGSWTALDAVEALEMPDDLARALRRNAAARRHFDAFPRGVRKNVLTWIAAAKRPVTRAARIAETVRLAAENRRANQERS